MVWPINIGTLGVTDEDHQLSMCTYKYASTCTMNMDVHVDRYHYSSDTPLASLPLQEHFLLVTTMAVTITLVSLLTNLMDSCSILCSKIWSASSVFPTSVLIVTSMSPEAILQNYCGSYDLTVFHAVFWKVNAHSSVQRVYSGGHCTTWLAIKMCLVLRHRF